MATTKETVPCVWHWGPSPRAYMAWQYHSEVRKQRGEKEIQCPDCKRWYWPDEYGEKPTTPTPDEGASDA